MKGPKNSSTQPAQAYAAQAQATDAEREKQLMDYLPLVKYIAGRIAIGLPKSVELDDLINAGVVGLIEAHNNFDSVTIHDSTDDLFAAQQSRIDDWNSALG